MLTQADLRIETRLKAEQLGLSIQCGSEGPINANTIIIGEGPGETEARTGKPFSGSSGNLLWDSLRPYNIRRDNVYITNVVKRQISLAKTGNKRHEVGADELQRWVALLNWELTQLPNIKEILVLGNYALQAVSPENGITNWRGSVIDCMLADHRKVRTVCTINPAYAQRELKYEPMFKMDLFKLNSVINNTYREHVVECVINPTFQEAMSWIQEFKYAKEAPSFDIEFINYETACYGLSNDPHLGVCINFRDGTSNRYSTHEEVDLMLAFQDLFETRSVIVQNGGFDCSWTWFKDRIKIRCEHDTLLAHHTLYPSLPHNLGFLVSQYSTHPFYKDEGTNWREGGDIDQYWRYNCKDSALTKHVAKKERVELEKQSLDKFFYNHVMKVQPHSVSATVHGMLVDTEGKEKAALDAAEECLVFKNEFYRLVHEATGFDDYFPNPGSWQQLQKLFFDYLGLTGRGKSTDATNRQHMLKHKDTRPIDKELLIALERFLKENKFRSTYAEMKIDEDNRVRCDYKQYGVTNAPGRLSSSATLWGTGMNMQNQPPRAKDAYIADKGCVLIYFDLAQAEARIVALRANIEKWKADFERARIDGSFDCHRSLASEMFKIPYDETPKKDTYTDEHGVVRYTIRYTSKRCRHGLNYRMQVDRLSEVTNLPYYEARKAFRLYHSITPELEEWWKEEERQFKLNRQIFNAFGRRYKVIQRFDEEVLKSIIAFYPQSTIGDKVQKVWYQAQEDDEWPAAARIVVNVHDNLIGCSVPGDNAKRALKIMKKYAEEPITVIDAWGKTSDQIIIPAELKMSVPDERGVHRWSNLKEVSL